jgi:hypothetical protein
MLEYWVWWNEIYFYSPAPHLVLKYGIIRFLYPFFHSYTIPLFHGLTGGNSIPLE